MISSSSCKHSCFLLLCHLSMVFDSDRKSFWLSVNEVNLSSFGSIVSCFLSCFDQIKVSFSLMFYEALILEFEWISLTSDRTTQSSYCRCRHWPFRKIVEPNVEISASSRWRLGRSIQILWSTSTLLRSNPPFYNIIKLNILWRPIWTFIELRSPLRRNRSLSFILIGMLNKWFNSCVDFVILLLLFLLTY